MLLLLLVQVTSLTAERDSMAAQNMALAAATSKLMATAAGSSTPSTESSAAGEVAGVPSALDSQAAVEALTASIGAAISLSGPFDSVSGPATSATRSSQAATWQQQHTVPRAGGVLSPAQAKEIGALLARLTNENAAFLKQKDAAVVARDEALNRLSALQAEVDQLQQQIR